MAKEIKSAKDGTLSKNFSQTEAKIDDAAPTIVMPRMDSEIHTLHDYINVLDNNSYNPDLPWIQHSVPKYAATLLTNEKKEEFESLRAMYPTLVEAQEN